MIKSGGVWYSGFVDSIVATDNSYVRMSGKPVIPYGSDEAKRIIQQVKEREKQRGRRVTCHGDHKS